MADGILVCNLPPELRSMNALHHHFRRFGEILKLTIQNAEGKAFVQFADQASAEAAKNEPVLGCASVEIKFVLRDREKRGCGRGRARGRGESGPSAPPEGTIQNRVLVTDPEERRRVDDATRKKDEISTRKRELQQQLTEQLKVLMVKLQDKELSEDRRESYRALLHKIKARLNVISGVASVSTTFEVPAAAPAAPAAAPVATAAVLAAVPAAPAAAPAPAAPAVAITAAPAEPAAVPAEPAAAPAAPAVVPDAAPAVAPAEPAEPVTPEPAVTAQTADEVKST